MKKLVCFLLIAVFSVSMFAGCSLVKDENIDTEEIRVGIIETRGTKEKSRILFLDDELKELGSLPINEANLGNIFDAPVIVDGSLYIIPQGYDTKKDAKKVLEIGLSDLEVTEYKIDKIAMSGVASNEDYVYTCNNLNGASYINRCDKVSGETKSIQMDDIYFSYITCAGNSLYVFGTAIQNDDTRKATLFEYDANLNLLSKTDISDCGINQYKAIEHNGNIIFTSGADIYEGASKTVGVFNLSDKSVSTIELSEKSPWDLQIYKDKLYVSHFDIVAHSGGGLSIYDFETGKSEYTAFDHGVEQMQIADGKMYILSDWKIYVYNADTLELIQTKELEPMDRDFSYLSGMLVIDN